MQQLFQLIKQRFEKLELVTSNKLNNDQYRELREQQRARCEKEAWILSMFRSKKINMTAAVKSNYFRYSYDIMRVIDPGFLFQAEPNLSDQTFLNDFVCLYTKFFDNYEDKFQFKVKIRNLLRPTNHNILNDMIKYLSDFSRDYIQHIYIWQLKSAKKLQQAAQQNQRKLSLSNNNVQSAIYQTNVPVGSQGQGQGMGIGQGIGQGIGEGWRDRPMQSFRNSVNIGDGGFRRYNDENETEIFMKRAEFNRNYGILEIQSLPNFIFIDKMKTNVDMLRLRMNQMYRDAKFRNTAIKSSISLYHNAYTSKFPNSNSNYNPKQNHIEDSHPHISHPYRVSLVIERNGFSCISITSNQQRGRDEKSLSPLKEKVRLSSLSNKETGGMQGGLGGLGVQGGQGVTKGKSQFMLNSLKVLRVSENFLPPLQRKQSTRVSSEQETTRQNQTLTKNLSLINTQNLLNHADPSHPHPHPHPHSHAHNGVIYYNQQLLRQAQRRKLQKRRITEMRKHFTSESKTKTTNSANNKNDPEDKIVEWLDKINMMKQLERKKILGLG